ncbi:MAG: hypothetical protein ABW022_20235 [Actinoplanes sp.]
MNDITPTAEDPNVDTEALRAKLIAAADIDLLLPFSLLNDAYETLAEQGKSRVTRAELFAAWEAEYNVYAEAPHLYRYNI